MPEKKGAAERATQNIPIVLTDAESIPPSLLSLQASKLIRLYAINASMAETLAPLVFLQGMRS
jgi:hypothetical protein